VLIFKGENDAQQNLRSYQEFSQELLSFWSRPSDVFFLIIIISLLGAGRMQFSFRTMTV